VIPTRPWRTLAHHHAAVPDDWRERLLARLEERPRRIGRWAELALYGARCCLDEAGETTLPPGAMLCVASLRGPVEATRMAMAERAERGSPMPFTFLQSQPSQMLAALCQHLHWGGDARFVLSRDTQALLRLVQLECGPAGLLLGRVDEGDEPRSEWWRMLPGSTGLRG
jgi:hypothetical protein